MTATWLATWRCSSSWLSYIEGEQQKTAAEATRKKADLEASLRTRLESATAAAIDEANVLEEAEENEFGELDHASPKSEYGDHSKCVENLKPDPQQRSKLPEAIPTALRSLSVGAG